MEVYHIENATLEDLEFIYSLFDEAIAYQKQNNFIGWNSYDKDFIRLDVEQKRQFKLMRGNTILFIFSICFSDGLIWRERDKENAVYLHRAVVNSAFKGQKLFEKVLTWLIELAHKKSLKYIRIDTWANNSNIIQYYINYGFYFIENYTTPNTSELPIQHRNLDVALLEFKL